MMKAALCTGYGAADVVDVRDVAEPTPAEGEVLIRVIATTVSSGDWRVRSMQVPAGLGLVARLAMGLRAPRQPILGSEVSGVVEQLSAGVSGFKVGDAVVGFPGVRMGGHAELCAVPVDRVTVLPPRLTHHQGAALCFGGSTALHFLRDRGAVREGHRVLVIGATGAVGSAGLQLARHFGAKVTAVCSSSGVAIAEELGAERVIDYAKGSIDSEGREYDLILDTVHERCPVAVRRVLAPGGRLLMVAAGLGEMAASLLPGRDGRRTVTAVSPERGDDVRLLTEWAGQGVWTPLIDSVHPLDQIRAAHRRVESGRKRGNVVVTVGG